MQIFIEILAIYVLAFVIVKYLKKNKHKNIDSPTPANMKPLDLNGKYHLKYLLSKTENTFYTILKMKCDKKGLIICPKVRLEDFILVTAKELNKYRGYIKSRHIDFLICSSNLFILAALELDDKSHDTMKASETDSFKNRLFESIKLPLFRIRTTDNYADKIDEMLQAITNK